MNPKSAPSKSCLKISKKDADISVHALKKRIALLQTLSKPNYKVSSTIAPCEVELARADRCPLQNSLFHTLCDTALFFHRLLSKRPVSHPSNLLYQLPSEFSLVLLLGLNR